MTKRYSIDDISSTLWTMIEENVAIICACLPMCRMLLAWVFPSVFDVSKASSSSSSSSPSSYGSGASRPKPYEWQPFSGSPKSEGFTHSTVQRGEGTSEEYILDSLHGDAALGKPTLEIGSIRKTTEYEISYENEPRSTMVNQVMTV